MVLRLRERVMGNKVELMNQTRGLLSDYGITIPQGAKALKAALHEVGEGKYPGLQGLVYEELMVLYDELLGIEGRVERYTRMLAEYAKTDDACQRLMTIPGIGPLSSVALVSKVGDCEQFKNGKKLASWLGLTPHVSSSGQTCHMGKISKRGDVRLRALLVHGARSYLQKAGKDTGPYAEWSSQLKTRLGHVNKAVIALANKNARIACALLKHGGTFDSELACMSR